jgi:hypothetical protein
VASISGDDLGVSTVGELLAAIGRVPDELIAYVPDGEEELGLESRVSLLTLDADSDMRNGLRYWLEVELIKDVIEVWSDWRSGLVPSLNERLAAVTYYAENDAYIPVG